MRYTKKESMAHINGKKAINRNYAWGSLDIGLTEKRLLKNNHKYVQGSKRMVPKELNKTMRTIPYK